MNASWTNAQTTIRCSLGNDPRGTCTKSVPRWNTALPSGNAATPAGVRQDANRLVGPGSMSGRRSRSQSRSAQSVVLKAMSGHGIASGA